MRIFLDIAYPGIVLQCCDALEAVIPGKRANFHRRGTTGCMEITMYSSHWPCLIPQSGPGKKHLRKIALTHWQTEIVEARHREFLRGSIHSDGCRIIAVERKGNYERRAVRYSFSNLSDDIKDLFCTSCDALGICWTRPSDRDIAVYRKASVARLDEFIGPKS